MTSFKPLVCTMAVDAFLSGCALVQTKESQNIIAVSAADIASANPDLFGAEIDENNGVVLHTAFSRFCRHFLTSNWKLFERQRA